MGRHGKNRQMKETVSTALRWAEKLAKEAPELKFRSLACKIGVDFLEESFHRAKDKSPGIDGVRKAVYEVNLKENLATLHEKLKEQRYRAPAVRRVMIPKDEHSQRALGLPTFEDKVAQGAVKMLLEAIYEQDFYDCSYGFRPKRNCHQALDALRGEIAKGGMRHLIDADIKRCFDSFDHKHLRELIGKRVLDGSIKRLVGKWLNAGVMDGNEIIFPERGTPQGGVISPLLANIYLHYVLDEWFETVVRPRCKGKVFLVRYADDFIIGCKLESDAKRIMKVLPQRFEKYGLTIHPEKTKLIDFSKPKEEETKAKSTFKFLGFCFYWGKNKDGYWVVKKKTAKERLARTKKRVNTWCKLNRHMSIKEQREKLVMKLKGYYNYYGVRCNYPRINVVYRWTLYCWHKWLNRRGAKTRLTWKRFYEVILKAYPLPTPRIMHAI